MTKIEIHKKGGFSERKGLKDFSNIVQIDSLNARTRNKLYSAFEKEFLDLSEHAYERSADYDEKFVYYLYIEVFSLVENDIPKGYNARYNYDEILTTIRNIFSSYGYNEVFDFVESIFSAFDYAEIDKRYFPLETKKYFIKSIEKILKEENVNYRVINDCITDIVSETEINSINEALTKGKNVTQNHISKALELLYKNKDYDNSIKESISAVESECQIITNNDKATLGDALKELPTTVHKALIEAFKKIYGYTSDANGIRHANGIGEGNSTFEEAKYMLISCSTFVNYLRDSIKKDE